MSDAGKTFADTVNARLEELGLNAFAVEKLGNLPADAIRSVIRDDDKRAVPRITRAKEICDLLGLEFYIGPPREPVAQPVADEKDYALVPLHEVALAAGGGFHNGAEDIVDHLTFKKSWLRSIHVDPANARLARVSGDSMQPSIFAGDLVLIDTSKREIPVRNPGGSIPQAPVFAIRTEDGARIKRVSQIGSLIVLQSDNPDHPPEFFDLKRWNQLDIIGRVMWWGHTLKG